MRCELFAQSIRTRLILFTMASIAIATTSACKTTPAPTPDPDITDTTITDSDTKPAATPLLESKIPDVELPSNMVVIKTYCPEENLQGDQCTSCSEVSLADAPIDGLVTVSSKRLGSYTSPGAVELLVTYDGCGVEESDFKEGALLTLTDDGWSVMHTFSLWSPASCQFYPAMDGRDVAWCETSSSKMGNLITAYWQPILTPDKIGHQELLTATADAANCPEEEVLEQEASIESVEDVDNDGDVDVIASFVDKAYAVPEGATDSCDVEEGVELEVLRDRRETRVFLMGPDGRFSLQK